MKTLLEFKILDWMRDIDAIRKTTMFDHAKVLVPVLMDLVRQVSKEEVQRIKRGEHQIIQKRIEKEIAHRFLETSDFFRDHWHQYYFDELPNDLIRLIKRIRVHERTKRKGQFNYNLALKVKTDCGKTIRECLKEGLLELYKLGNSLNSPLLRDNGNIWRSGMISALIKNSFIEGKVIDYGTVYAKFQCMDDEADAYILDLIDYTFEV